MWAVGNSSLLMPGAIASPHTLTEATDFAQPPQTQIRPVASAGQKTPFGINVP